MYSRQDFQISLEGLDSRGDGGGYGLVKTLPRKSRGADLVRLGGGKLSKVGEEVGSGNPMVDDSRVPFNIWYRRAWGENN